MRGLDALDKLFAETERDRRHAARWQARSERTAAAVDRLGMVRRAPWIVFGGGVLMWFRLSQTGGTWAEHAAVVAIMVAGVWLIRRPAGRRPVVRIPSVVGSQWMVVGFVAIVAVIATVVS
jgi:hypothetical protein